MILLLYHKITEKASKIANFHQYITLGFPSFIALGCSIFKPSRSQRVCCGVSSNASVSLRGHWNLPLSSRLYKSRNPSPSHRSPLMRSHRLPQNKNNDVLYGSSCNCACTIVASPSIERRRSVYPVTMYTCLFNYRLFSIIHVLMQAKYLLRYLPEVIFASHFSRYEYLMSILEQLLALLPVQIPNTAPELCEDDNNKS